MTALAVTLRNEHPYSVSLVYANRTEENTMNNTYTPHHKTLQCWQNVLTKLSYLLINFRDLSLTVKLGSTQRK